MSSRKHASHHSSKDSSQKGKNKSRSTETQAPANYTTNSDYWCEVCALHIQNCRCVPYDHGAAANTWQNLQATGNTSSAVADPTYFDPNAFTWSASISDQSYYAASPGQTASPYAYPSGTSPGTDYNAAQQSAASKSSNSADSQERRQKANRNSQRKHRLNQMKVVEDLKHQVSDLTNKNQKISKKISALDQGQMYQVEGEEDGDGMQVLVHAGTDQVGGYVMPWGDGEE